jgi:hypothetical protein
VEAKIKAERSTVDSWYCPVLGLLTKRRKKMLRD